MALTELNVFATAATSIDEAVSSVFIEATTDEQRIVGARGCEPVDVTPCEAINLHGNCIRSLAHSLHAPNLTSLNLSSNNIEALDGSLLAALPRLAALDLSSNAISKIEGMGGLTALTRLGLSCNLITDVKWLAAFHSPSHSLQHLDLTGNKIRDLESTASVLSSCRHLIDVRFCSHTADDEDTSLTSNPICGLPVYASTVLSSCPGLATLDGIPRKDPRPKVITGGPSGASPPRPPPPPAPVAPPPAHVSRLPGPDPELAVLRNEVGYMREETQRIAFASRLNADTLQAALQERTAQLALAKKELKDVKAQLRDVIGAAQTAGKSLREELDRKTAECDAAIARTRSETESAISRVRAEAHARLDSETAELRRALERAQRTLEGKDDECRRVKESLARAQTSLEENVAVLSTVPRLHEELAEAQEALRAALEGKEVFRLNLESSSATKAEVASLRTQLEAKGGEIALLNRQLLDADRRVGDAMKASADSAAAAEAAEQREAKAVARLAAAEEEARAARGEVTTLRVSERHLQSEIDHCKSELREAKSAVALLREDASVSRQEHSREVSRLMDALETMRASARAAEAEAGNLRSELVSSRSSESGALRELERERAASHAREREHASLVSALRDELASARVELRAGVDNGSALTALQAEVKSREMEGLQAALRVKEVEMEKADLMRQMKGLKRECEMRVRAVGESAEEELRRSVAAVRAEMTSAQTDAASHKRAVEAAQAELLVVRAQLASVQKELTEKCAIIARLEDEARALRKVAADAEIGRGQGMEEASRSLRIAEEMKSRLLDARENLTVAEAALRDAKKEVKVKEVQLDDAQDSIRKLKASLAVSAEEHSIAEEGMRDAIQQLQGEAEGWKGEAEAAQDRANGLAKQLETMEADLSSLRTRAEAAEEELRTLRGEHGTLVSAHQTVTAKLSAAERTLVEREAQVSELRVSRDEAEARASKLHTQAQAMVAEITHTRAQLADAQEKAAAQKEAATEKLRHTASLISQLTAQLRPE